MRIFGGKGVLVLALVLGVATSYISWRYVQQNTAAAQPVETVSVVVASQPIPQRTIVGPGMVQIRQIPSEGRSPGAYADPGQVVGRVSKSQLAPGEQLMPHQFFLQREQSGLAFMIPESHRAVAVGISEVIATGGLIIPGDKVDVYALFDLKESDDDGAGLSVNGVVRANTGREPDKNTMIALILQDVEVLAVAQRIEGEDPRGTSERIADQALEGGNGAPPQAPARPAPQARTVTLSVTPDQAGKLILAEERGKIRLALRPAEENGHVDLMPLDLRHVLREPTR